MHHAEEIVRPIRQLPLPAIAQCDARIAEEARGDSIDDRFGYVPNHHRIGGEAERSMAHDAAETGDDTDRRKLADPRDDVAFMLSMARPTSR